MAQAWSDEVIIQLQRVADAANQSLVLLDPVDGAARDRSVQLIRELLDDIKSDGKPHVIPLLSEIAGTLRGIASELATIRADREIAEELKAIHNEVGEIKENLAKVTRAEGMLPKPGADAIRTTPA